MCKRDNEPGHNTWPCVCLFYKRFWQLRINTNVSWCVFVCVCSRFNLTCKQFAATININKIWNYVEILWIYMEIAYASILFVCPFLFWLLRGAQKNTHAQNKLTATAIMFKLFIVLLTFYLCQFAAGIFEWNLNVQFVFDFHFWLGKFDSVFFR